jgi:hypothetical protein
MSSRTHINLKNPKVAFSILFVIALVFVVFARGGTTTTSENLTKKISCEENEWLESPFFNGDLSNCPDIVEYLFKPAYVNELASELNLRFVTFPAGKFGSAMRMLLITWWWPAEQQKTVLEQKVSHCFWCHATHRASA